MYLHEPRHVSRGCSGPGRSCDQSNHVHIYESWLVTQRSSDQMHWGIVISRVGAGYKSAIPFIMSGPIQLNWLWLDLSRYIICSEPFILLDRQFHCWPNPAHPTSSLSLPPPPSYTSLLPLLHLPAPLPIPPCPPSTTPWSTPSIYWCKKKQFSWMNFMQKFWYNYDITLQLFSL